MPRTTETAKTTKSMPCDACGGSGIVSNATEDVQCSTCNGTGRVKVEVAASSSSSPKAERGTWDAEKSDS